MEEKKQKGTSSSFTSELFGSKESYPSSSGIFGSIFSPPSPKVLGRESLRSELNGKTANKTWSSKVGTKVNSNDIYKGNDGQAQNTENKDMSSIYQDQTVQPCHLSSSIYYGGQDIYSHPQSTQTAEVNSLRMIQELLQEETGGKGLSIIKITLPKARHVLLKAHSRIV